MRRSLKLAEEWGELKRAPKITLAKGERQRERVLTDEEVKLYLMACAQPWRDIATILYCLGIRPGELYPLRWEHILFEGEGGFIRIVKGKSAKARRSLPMVPGVYRVLKSRHDQQAAKLPFRFGQRLDARCDGQPGQRTGEGAFIPSSP